MIKIQNAAEDIIPLTDFRNRLAAVMTRVKERKSPVILTQSGRATAVVMSMEAYEELMHNYETARSAVDGLTELVQGEHPKYEGVKRRAGR